MINAYAWPWQSSAVIENPWGYVAFIVTVAVTMSVFTFILQKKQKEGVLPRKNDLERSNP